MELGLAHSLSRYKLKFSPDKIDTMIVQVNTKLFDIFNNLTMNRTSQNPVSRLGRNCEEYYIGIPYLFVTYEQRGS